MSHILVERKDDGKWDVYLVKCIADTSVGLRLMGDPAGTVKSLEDEFVHISWNTDQPPSLANILAIGKYCQHLVSRTFALHVK